MIIFGKRFRPRFHKNNHWVLTKIWLCRINKTIAINETYCRFINNQSHPSERFADVTKMILVVWMEKVNECPNFSFLKNY